MFEASLGIECETDTRWVDTTITVLHVDDDPALAEMCAEFLEREAKQLTVETATSAEEGLEHINKQTPDCIVSDYDMPGMDGLEFLEQVRETHPEVPFILFTGKGSEEIASEAISAGVTDYLQKSRGRDQYRILRNRIRNGVSNYRSKRSLRMFRSAVEHSGHSIYLTDRDGVIEYVNPSFTEITGYDPEEAIGRTPTILKSGRHEDRFYADLWETILGGEVWESEIINERKDGELYVAEQTIAPIFIGADEPEKFVAVNHEITEQKRHQLKLEAQCDSFGALNRMLRYRIRDDLQAVTGYAELLDRHVDDAGAEYLEILEGRSWDVFDRLEAAQNFTDLLYRAEAEGPRELEQILRRAVKGASSVGQDVSIAIDGDVSSKPIVVDTVLESVVRILLENLFRAGKERSSEFELSVTECDESLSIQVKKTDPTTSGRKPKKKYEGDVLDVDSAVMSNSELYILLGLIDGHGGEIEVERRDSAGVGFTVEFPTLGFVADTV